MAAAPTHDFDGYNCCTDFACSYSRLLFSAIAYYAGDSGSDSLSWLVMIACDPDSDSDSKTLPLNISTTRSSHLESDSLSR